jgi:hypothetical protein
LGGSVTMSTSSDVLVSASCSSGYLFISMSIVAVCIFVVLFFVWFIVWYCRRQRPNGFFNMFRDQGWRLL